MVAAVLPLDPIPKTDQRSLYLPSHEVSGQYHSARGHPSWRLAALHLPHQCPHEAAVEVLSPLFASQLRSFGAGEWPLLDPRHVPENTASSVGGVPDHPHRHRAGQEGGPVPVLGSVALLCLLSLSVAPAVDQGVLAQVQRQEESEAVCRARMKDLRGRHLCGGERKGKDL